MSTERPERGRLGRLAVVAAAFAVGLLSLAPAASARPAAQPAARAAAPSAGAAFGIQPATATKPDSRADFTYSATPGATLTDHVAVVNLSTAPVTLNLSATDATSTPTGGFTLLPSAAKPTDLGSWVTITGPHTVTLPARTAKGPAVKIVSFAVAVPTNASPGDHAGGVVVSLIGTAQNKQGVDVKLDQRVATRVYLRVSGPVHASLAVENLRIRYAGPGLLGSPFADGTMTLSYRVRNTGNVILGATQSATIRSTLGGAVHVTGLALVPPLLPGAEIEVTRAVHGIFPGLHLTATVRLAPIVPTGAADHDVVASSAAASLWAVPWPLVALIVLLLFGLGALGWRWRRGRRPRPDAPTSHRRVPALARS
jgi:hypothetical protein